VTKPTYSQESREIPSEDPYRDLGEALAVVIRKELREALADVTMPGANTFTMVSVGEAAHRLGPGKTKLNRLIAAGELGSVLVGRRRLVPVEAIESYVRRLQEPEQHRNQPKRQTTAARR
jgi:excisionase family DNA binding protein